VEELPDVAGPRVPAQELLGVFREAARGAAVLARRLQEAVPREREDVLRRSESRGSDTETTSIR